MKRRDLLQLMGAAGLVAVGGESWAASAKNPVSNQTDAPIDPFEQDDYCWGDFWLPLVLDALGIPAVHVRGVRLHFEYGMFASALVTLDDGSQQQYIFTRFGTTVVSNVLNLPRGVQAITVQIEKGCFVIAECRYAPIDTGGNAFVAALKAGDDPLKAYKLMEQDT